MKYVTITFVIFLFIQLSIQLPKNSISQHEALNAGQVCI